MNLYKRLYRLLLLWISRSNTEEDKRILNVCAVLCLPICIERYRCDKALERATVDVRTENLGTHIRTDGYCILSPLSISILNTAVNRRIVYF